MAVTTKASRPRCTPSLTRSGKTRIKGFTIVQLEDLYDKSSKKAKHKIRSRIQNLVKREK